MSDHLYIICRLLPDGGHAAPSKIGIAANVDTRLRGLRTGCPFEIAWYERWSFKPGGSRAIERDLHHWFSKRRLHGEWFDVSPLEIREQINRWIDPTGRYGRDFGVPGPTNTEAA